MPTTPTLRKSVYEMLPRKRYVKMKIHYTTVKGEKFRPGDIFETTNSFEKETKAPAWFEVVGRLGERVVFAGSEVSLPENGERQNAFAAAALVNAVSPLADFVNVAMTDEERSHVGAVIIEHAGRLGTCVRDLKIGDLIEILDDAGLITLNGGQQQSTTILS